MNKLLLSSLCAVALSSSASAFVLDLSSLIGQQSGTINHPSGQFQVQTNGAIVAYTDNITNTNTGRVNLGNAQTLEITYPATVTYIASFIGGNVTVSDNGSKVTFLSNEPNTTVDTVNFSVTAPVPEPTSTALLGIGGLALILRRRK